MSLPSSSNIERATWFFFFKYTKNLKLLFISGPSYIFWNVQSLLQEKRKEKHTKGKSNNNLFITKTILNPQQNQGKQLECVLYSWLFILMHTIWGKEDVIVYHKMQVYILRNLVTSHQSTLYYKARKL